MADIFISYTSSDRDWAHWIAGELTVQGHTPHVHDWEIGAGDDIYGWMEKRHDAADHVLCVVSDAYLKAPYSTLERNAAVWQSASNRPGFVIFVVVKPCRLPTLTDHIRRCELFGIDRDEAQKRFRDFMATRQAPKNFVFPGQVYALSNIPVRLPEHFVGRDDALDAIDKGLSRYEGRVAITALHGLRGVGKTTLAAAYADRKRAEYRATWWVHAHTPEGMRADLVALGIRLGWVSADAKEEPALAGVLERLANEGDGILLIYDNAMDSASLRPFLPKGGAARVLVTSNFHAWRGMAAPVEIRIWPKEIGGDYFVARTGRDDERDAAESLSAALGGLPLAHEQAAAYCERLSVSLAGYLKRFEAQPLKLLDDRRHAAAEYNISHGVDLAQGASGIGKDNAAVDDVLTVARTFSLAIAEAAKLHPAAEPLLAHAAILPPESIPLFLFAEGREALAEPLRSLLADDGLDEALAALAAFALIERETVPDERDPESETACFRLHRLVRQVSRPSDGSGRAALVRALAGAYPPNPFLDSTQWIRCRRLNGHVMHLAGAADTDPASAEPVAQLLNAIARFQQGANAANAAARPLFEHALALREKALGPDHPATAEILSNLARLHQDDGDFTAALPLSQRAVAILEKSLGPDHPGTAGALDRLAGLRQAAGDLPEARRLQERALAALEKGAGPDHPDTATSLDNLAGVLRDSGDVAAARPLLERALAIREKALGPDHVTTAISLANLALNLHEAGDLAGAQAQFERAMPIFESRLGAEHPGLAMNLGNFARLLAARGNHAAAQAAFERSLAILEKGLGPDHPQTAICTNNLGWLHQERGNLAEARRFYERALAAFRKSLGPDHLETVTIGENLAMFLREMGDLAAARPLIEHTLAVREKTLGPDHPKTGISLGNLALFRQDEGDLAGARALFERSLAVIEKSFGAHHSRTATTLGNFARLLRAEGDLAAARSLFERVVAIHTRTSGPEQPQTANAMLNLATTLQQQGDLAAARPLFEQALAIMQKSLGDAHPSTNRTRLEFARFKRAEGSGAEALALAEPALDRFAAIYGPRHRATLDAAAVTADALTALGRNAEAAAVLEKYSLSEKTSRASPFPAHLIM